uniref:Uncharacterized protein n=1 Tax=Panagrolaimus sp. ES5 TaxID=591445 RepID=A0AC34G266_9BILA
MAFSRNSSSESNDIEGFAVRSGHLAPPTNTPDSPRPQKTSSSGPEALSTTLTIPSEKAAADSKQKSSAKSSSQLSSK